MRHFSFLRLLVSGAYICVSVACSPLSIQLNEQVHSQQQQLDDWHDSFLRAQQQAEREAAQFVAMPWVVGKAQKIDKKALLPEALQQHVKTTLLFSQPTSDLLIIADRITRATGIPVHVQDEALQQRQLATQVILTNSVNSNSPHANLALSAHDESLAVLLDKLCAQFDVYWRYERDRIEIFKTETRFYELKALMLQARSFASLGASDDYSEGFTSQSGTHLHSNEYDAATVIRERIESFLSPLGRLSASTGASATLIVSDTPTVLEKVEAYLQRENRSLSRRIRLVFEEITVALHESDEAALRWSALLSHSRFGLSLLGGELEQSGRHAAQLGAGLRAGPWADSNAFISALHTIGTVVRRNSVPVLTLNRRPVTHALRTTFSYIDKIERIPLQQYSNHSTQAAVSLSQKEQTVGSILTLVPEALDDGQLLLSVAYDHTTAQPLSTLNVGSGDQALQIQQLTVDGNGIVQQVIIDSGVPLLISGFEHSQYQGNQRRLNADAPLALGGADQYSSKRLRTIILLTAYIEEGAL